MKTLKMFGNCKRCLENVERWIGKFQNGENSSNMFKKRVKNWKMVKDVEHWLKKFQNIENSLKF